jgi:GcrA cell cycle regulator
MEPPDTGEEAPHRVTPDREAQLKGQAWWQEDGNRRETMLSELWFDRDISTAEIARLIGDGCTKNMVISKAHRLGLEPRGELKPKPAARGLAIDALTANGCRWPHGHPGQDDFHFCGAPSLTGRPYCEHHCKVAYVKTDKRGNPIGKSKG